MPTPLPSWTISGGHDMPTPDALTEKYPLSAIPYLNLLCSVPLPWLPKRIGINRQQCEQIPEQSQHAVAGDVAQHRCAFRSGTGRPVVAGRPVCSALAIRRCGSRASAADAAGGAALLENMAQTRSTLSRFCGCYHVCTPLRTNPDRIGALYGDFAGRRSHHRCCHTVAWEVVL